MTALAVAVGEMTCCKHGDACPPDGSCGYRRVPRPRDRVGSAKNEKWRHFINQLGAVLMSRPSEELLDTAANHAAYLSECDVADALRAIAEGEDQVAPGECTERAERAEVAADELERQGYGDVAGMLRRLAWVVRRARIAVEPGERVCEQCEATARMQRARVERERKR